MQDLCGFSGICGVWSGTQIGREGKMLPPGLLRHSRLRLNNQSSLRKVRCQLLASLSVPALCYALTISIVTGQEPLIRTWLGLCRFVICGYALEKLFVQHRLAVWNYETLFLETAAVSQLRWILFKRFLFFRRDLGAWIQILYSVGGGLSWLCFGPCSLSMILVIVVSVWFAFNCSLVVHVLICSYLFFWGVAPETETRCLIDFCKSSSSLDSIGSASKCFKAPALPTANVKSKSVSRNSQVWLPSVLRLPS